MLMQRIAVLTRPQGRNEVLATRLEAAGWSSQCLPALEIQPLAVDDAALPLPQDFDLVVFVSGNAARLYLNQLQTRTDLGCWPVSVPAATVGPFSAQALKASEWFGANTTVLHPDASASNHDSEALWNVLGQEEIKPERVLIVRGTQGRDWLVERFSENSAQVRCYAVYRRVPAPWSAHTVELLRTWAAEDVFPTWLLTSSESVLAIENALKQLGLVLWWARCRFVVTNPKLQQRLQTSLAGARTAAMVKVCLPVDDSIFNAFVTA
jgi:uroporphyrinogen-III synthase